MEQFPSLQFERNARVPWFGHSQPDEGGALLSLLPFLAGKHLWHLSMDRSGGGSFFDLKSEMVQLPALPGGSHRRQDSH